MREGIILRRRTYVLRRIQAQELKKGCPFMRIKKSLLLLAFTIIFIIGGSYLVTKKISDRTAGGQNDLSQPGTEMETIPPIDDETFLDTSDSIRVALHTTGFSSLFHTTVSISCDTDYEIITEHKTIEKAAGEKTKFSKIKEETLIQLAEEQGQITIDSIERNGSAPSYRGTITLYPEEGQIVVVNELSMEEYLYGVVPSEMPVSYGEEALKLQAVSARSYAMEAKNKTTYEAYHADVVDSTASQVYKNTEEDGRANQAVRDTKGQIFMNGEEIATTYFFSTSCGYTTNASDVWFTKRNEQSPEYLTGHFQGEDELELNLKKEKDFRTFINYPENYDTFEQEDTWYRWTITERISDIEKSLKAIYPEQMGKIGELKKITLKERGTGGVAKICKITGSKGSFVIEKENAIRKALAVSGTKIFGQNEKVMTVSSLLPSGYFYIEQKKGTITFHGGGFGHGVGMSQTGAMRMAEAGYTWEEMAEHYFPGITIQTCY